MIKIIALLLNFPPSSNFFCLMETTKCENEIIQNKKLGMNELNCLKYMESIFVIQRKLFLCLR